MTGGARLRKPTASIFAARFQNPALAFSMSGEACRMLPEGYDVSEAVVARSTISIVNS
jgi:hypothetical protein